MCIFCISHEWLYCTIVWYGALMTSDFFSQSWAVEWDYLQCFSLKNFQFNAEKWVPVFSQWPVAVAVSVKAKISVYSKSVISRFVFCDGYCRGTDCWRCRRLSVMWITQPNRTDEVSKKETVRMWTIKKKTTSNSKRQCLKKTCKKKILIKCEVISFYQLLWYTRVYQGQGYGLQAKGGPLGVQSGPPDSFWK